MMLLERLSIFVGLESGLIRNISKRQLEQMRTRELLRESD